MGKQFSTIASRTGAHDRQPQNTCLGIDGACPVLLRLSRWRVFLRCDARQLHVPGRCRFEPGHDTRRERCGLLLFRAFFPNGSKGALGLLDCVYSCGIWRHRRPVRPAWPAADAGHRCDLLLFAGSLGRSCPLGGVSQDCGVQSCRVAGWDCLRRGNRHAVRRQRGVLRSPCSIDRSRRRRSCAPCGLPSMLCGRTLRRCDPGLRWADAKRAGCA